MITSAQRKVPGLLSRAELTEVQKDEMFSLLWRYFDGVTRPQFESDLEEKNWVIEIRKGAELVGFSTLLMEAKIYEGAPITVVYSGDTIMAPDAWGSPMLARTWIAAVNCLREDGPSRRCYWLLLTSGFRTYRFLPVFWREFFPRYDAVTPPDQQRLLDRLASDRYGCSYAATTGLVRFPCPQRLRGRLSHIPPGRVHDPHVKFFLEHNAGYAVGDELVCLTELSNENLTPAGRRMVAPAR